METPKTLLETIKYFSYFENCRQFMIAVRWPDGKIKCPTCGSEKVTYLQNARLYKCYENHPRPKFSLKIGTIFEDSPLPLEKWLPAVWLLVSCKNGVSSWEIHRALGITQKSAWFMMHRIRLALQTGSLVKIGDSGTGVEVDETFIGGKARNMHKHVKARRITGTGPMDKTPVMGILERGDKSKGTHSKVITMVVPDRKKKTLQTEVKAHVQAGAALYSDALRSYEGLDSEYAHQVVDHAVEYVRGKVHTNGTENFWCLTKRTIGGTYVSVEPFHLFRYLDEQSFRFNHRGNKENPVNDGDRFRLAMSTIVGKRLTYAELTGKTTVRPL
jgi:transposase-like protein